MRRPLTALAIALLLAAPGALAQTGGTGEGSKVYTPPPGQAAEIFKDADASAASLNPLDNNLQNLEIAIQIPDAFDIPDGAARFDFGVTLGDGSRPFDEHFVLVPTRGIADAALDAAALPGRHFETYRLADADRARMGAAYAKLQALRAVEDPTGQRALNFSISSTGCLVDPADAPDIFVSRSFARSDARVNFVPMSNDWEIDRDTSPDWLDFWEPCEG